MINHWIRAFRLRTLPLTFASIGLGSFIAAGHGHFRWNVFLLSLSTAILLQLLSNLANDYGDFIHGADSDKRTGPERTVQSGVISVVKMRNAIILFSLLSFISGSTLLLISLSDKLLLITFFALGIAAIWASVRYTTGSKPYGYSGLGDPAVFFFFGLIGVGGSYYLHGEYWDPMILLPSAALGLFSVAVLNVNNLRDIESDKEAGKQSIPVRVGKKGGVLYHWAILIIGNACAISYAWFKPNSWFEWVFLILLPLWISQAIALWNKPSQKLDPYLKITAITTLAFAFLFGLGQLITLDPV